MFESIYLIVYKQIYIFFRISFSIVELSRQITLIIPTLSILMCLPCLHLILLDPVVQALVLRVLLPFQRSFQKQIQILIFIIILEAELGILGASRALRQVGCLVVAMVSQEEAEGEDECPVKEVHQDREGGQPQLHFIVKLGDHGHLATES